MYCSVSNLEIWSQQMLPDAEPLQVLLLSLINWNPNDWKPCAEHINKPPSDGTTKVQMRDLVINSGIGCCFGGKGFLTFTRQYAVDRMFGSLSGASCAMTHPSSSSFITRKCALASNLSVYGKELPLSKNNKYLNAIQSWILPSWLKHKPFYNRPLQKRNHILANSSAVAILK